MRIKFTDSNFEKITEQIKSAEGKSRERLLTVDRMQEIFYRIEKKLNISKKALQDVTICVDANNQAFPRKYKYTPYSTYFVAEYKSGAWYILDIYRGICGRLGSNGIKFELTDMAKEAIVNSVLKSCTI